MSPGDDAGRPSPAEQTHAEARSNPALPKALSGSVWMHLQ